MMTTGTASAASRIRPSTPAAVIPCSSATCVVRWIVGPSARGSEKGTPTSTRSAPAAATRRSASRDAATVGNPAVRYGISARPPPPLPPSPRHRVVIGCSDKVVADLEAVLEWVRDFDDGAGEMALLVFLGEVDHRGRFQERAIGGRHDAH